MSSKSKKIKVGIFVASAGAVVAAVLVVFGGMRFWQRHDTYYVVVDDSVIGLEEGANVLFNGIKVGSVESLATTPDDLRKVRVRLEVDRGLPIRTDTKAMLRFVGITGLKIVDLRGATATAPRLRPGSVIATGETMIDVVARKSQALMDQSEALMAKAATILETTQTVVTNVATITDPKAFVGVDEIVAQTRIAATNLAKATGGLRTMIDQSKAAVAGTLASVDDAAHSAARLLDEQVTPLIGDARTVVGDLSGVIRDNQTELSSAMSDVRQASRSFRELARELREKPSRLLFSGSPHDRKLP